MQSKKFFKKLNHPYLVPFALIFLTIIFLFIYFAAEEYSLNRNKLQKSLTAEAERVERTFTDIIDHTSFIMKIIITQIKPNYEDKEYIYNVINKYAVNPNLNNILSWTIFSWIDENHKKVVDSISGSNIKIKDDSRLEYIKKTRLYPNRMHLGEAIYGFTSQRYSIPAGIGVYNGEKYIGALTIGFDLVQLSQAVEDAIQDEAIYFAFLDRNFDIIMQSPSNIKSLDDDNDTIKNIDIKNFIAEKNMTFENLTSISQINLIKDGTNHYVYRIRDYPYVLYLRYDNKAVHNVFWKDITFRVIEIIVIGFVAFVIVILIYNREKQLREQAISAQKEAEKASQAKTNFLAYTAHELRSPLAYIISSSEMILNQVFGKIPKKCQEYIRSIHYSSKELLEFIDDLLNDMRAREGKFHIKTSDVDVKDLIFRAVKINSINYNNKVKFEIDLAENVPKLKTDPKRLSQIFNNIISNAIKYSKEGTVLKIHTKLKDSGLKIYFKDQGIGMSKEELDLSRIKFGVVRSDKKRKGESVGLGLPLVIELTNALGGKFNINSKVGFGTEVTIFFPKKLLQTKKHEQ